MKVYYKLKRAITHFHKMFRASQALILGCAEKTEKVLCQRECLLPTPSTPFHCFMGHLETETSCSFHTFSVLASEPGITYVLWKLYFEFESFLEPHGTPRCSRTYVLSCDWKTPVPTCASAPRPILLFKGVLLGLRARTAKSCNQAWSARCSSVEVSLVQLKRGGGVGYFGRADFLTGGHTWTWEKGCWSSEPSVSAGTPHSRQAASSVSQEPPLYKWCDSGASFSECAYTTPSLFSGAWADQMLSRRHPEQVSWDGYAYLGFPCSSIALSGQPRSKGGRPPPPPQKKKNAGTEYVVHVH